MSGLYKVIETVGGGLFFTGIDAAVADGDSVYAPKNNEPGLSLEEASAMCSTAGNLLRMAANTTEEIGATPREGALMFSVLYKHLFKD